MVAEKIPTVVLSARLAAEFYQLRRFNFTVGSDWPEWSTRSIWREHNDFFYFLSRTGCRGLPQTNGFDTLLFDKPHWMRTDGSV